MRTFKRFEVIQEERQGLVSSTTIYVDTETGVNYMFVRQGYSGGLTPLLDENGKVIVTKR